MTALQKEGLETIAVICKTVRECRDAFQHLQQHAELKLIDKETRTFQKGVVVIPVYLAKGIEFSLLSGGVFEGEKTEIITLKRSYRSTKEIVELTKRIIEGGEEIEAFNRNGKKPTLTISADPHAHHKESVPFLYMKNKLKGGGKNTAIRHLFIDEAQDYTPFQLAFLESLFPACSITMLGDLNQAILAHAYHDKLASIVAEREFKPLKQAVKAFGFIDFKGTYLQLFSGRYTPQTRPDDWQSICTFTQKSFRFEKLLYEDDRIEQTGKWLLQLLNKYERQERKKDWVIEESELLDKEEYLKAYKRLQEEQRFTENTFDDYERERNL
ncbi:hypothetical protein DT075_12600 [Bacillus licheniformis]|nr:hypothetical protein DT075_12600 [Bacillus licheniformis]